MKKILMLMLLSFSISSYAVCPLAPPTTSPEFCTQFKAIASCHCQADGHLPASLCSDMNTIYSRMIATFKTQDAACSWQEKNGSAERTSHDQCMRDWDCYRLGAGQCYAKCM